MYDPRKKGPTEYTIEGCPVVQNSWQEDLIIQELRTPSSFSPIVFIWAMAPEHREGEPKQERVKKQQAEK